MRARFPGLGSRPSDFQIWPNFLMRHPSHRPALLGEPSTAPPVAINPILLENGNLLLLENGNYLQLE
jgi:hypothetical protein